MEEISGTKTATRIRLLNSRGGAAGLTWTREELRRLSTSARKAGSSGMTIGGGGGRRGYPGGGGGVEDSRKGRVGGSGGPEGDVSPERSEGAPIPIC